jgi:hypothetical protein
LTGDDEIKKELQNMDTSIKQDGGSAETADPKKYDLPVHYKTIPKIEKQRRKWFAKFMDARKAGRKQDANRALQKLQSLGLAGRRK